MPIFEWPLQTGFTVHVCVCLCVQIAHCHADIDCSLNVAFPGNTHMLGFTVHVCVCLCILISHRHAAMGCSLECGTSWSNSLLNVCYMCETRVFFKYTVKPV